MLARVFWIYFALFVTCLGGSLFLFGRVGPQDEAAFASATRASRSPQNQISHTQQRKGVVKDFFLDGEEHIHLTCERSELTVSSDRRKVLEQLDTVYCLIEEKGDKTRELTTDRGLFDLTAQTFTSDEVEMTLYPSPKDVILKGTARDILLKLSPGHPTFEATAFHANVEVP